VVVVVMPYRFRAQYFFVERFIFRIFSHSPFFLLLLTTSSRRYVLREAFYGLIFP
jgi:hypothetical protein